jgi:hypothetical protein
VTGAPGDTGSTNVPAVQWDREKPSNRLKRQEELLHEYLVHHLYPYSPFYRRRFDGAKVSVRNVTSVSDLARLEPTSWGEVEAEPAAFLLRPTERAIARFGDRRLVMAIARAKLRGKVAQLNRDLIDPAYKPIHWHLEGDVPMGYSSEDLDRLAEAGRRMFQLAGVARDDVMVGITPPGPNLAHWQLVDGARQAGLSSIHLGPDAPLDRLEATAPNVLAGTPAGLLQVLQALESGGRKLAGLRTVLAVGDVVDDAARDALLTVGRFVGDDDLEVVAAWAPPGVRALWTECRGGRGFHTYPDLEWVEVLPDGEIAWTSLSWHGTTFVRLRTGVSGTIDETVCPTCGRVGPKLNLAVPAARPAPPPAAPPEEAEFAPPAVAPAAAPVPELDTAALRVLDDHPRVAAWAAEYRRVDGVEELIVFVAPAGVDRLGPLFRELDSRLRATQYVVLDAEAIRDRVARDGPILDRRS